MKAYLSQSQTGDDSFKHFSNIASFSRGVLDSEAQEIVCDRFLSSFSYSETEKLLEIIFKKMRTGCQLTIIEPDFYLISKHLFKDSVHIDIINGIVFKDNVIKCMLTMDKIAGMINPALDVIEKHFDEQSCVSIIKIRRNK
jgi:hypothetical protein|tara:strand:- start:58933 stop:59355 length:423 start_codon:yes stop_codon:yes gene_type:complete